MRSTASMSRGDADAFECLLHTNYLAPANAVNITPDAQARGVYVVKFQTINYVVYRIHNIHYQEYLQERNRKTQHVHGII